MNNTDTTQARPTAIAAPAPAPQAQPAPQQAAAGAIDPAAFKKAVTWAAQNPDTAQAKELQQRIVGGKYNDTIKGMGLDPAQFGYKAPPVVLGSQEDLAAQRAASDAQAAATREKVGGFFQGIGERATNETAQGFKDAYTKLKEDLSAGTVAGGVHAVADVANGVFAPIAAAFNAVTGGAVPKAVDTTGKAIADIPGLAGVLNHFNDYFDQHPDVKRLVLEDLPTFLNVASMFAGGTAKPGEIVPPKLSEAANTAVDATKTAATKVTDLAGAAVDKTVETAGKAADAASSFATGAKAAIRDRAVNTLEADYERWTGATKSGAKALGKGDVRTAALDRAGTIGKPPQRILAEAGIVPETNGQTNSFSTAGQAAELRKALEPLNEANQAALKEVDMSAPPKPIDQLEAETINRIRAVKKPAGEVESMVADARKEFALLRQKYGDSIKASDMGQEKVNYSGGVKFDANRPLQNDVNYQIRRTLQKGVEDTATAAGHEDVAQLNREIGDRLAAADMLDNLNGQKLKYGKIGKYALMGIGATLGHGILGKVFGAIGGNVVADILMKADVAGPVKRLILRTVEQRDPAAYQQTLDWLKQQGLDRGLRLALPPGGEGTKAPIQLPDTAGRIKDAQIKESQAKIAQ